MKPSHEMHIAFYLDMPVYEEAGILQATMYINISYFTMKRRRPTWGGDNDFCFPQRDHMPASNTNKLQSASNSHSGNIDIEEIEIGGQLRDIEAS